MDNVSLIILVPLIAGIVLLALPGKLRPVKGILCLLVTLVTAVWAWSIFTAEPSIFRLSPPEMKTAGEQVSMLLQSCYKYLRFSIDSLSQVIVLLTALFGVLISLYSLTGISREDRCPNFHSYFLITLGLTYGTVMTDNLLLFIFLWGILGLTLYKLIPANDEESSAAAKKTLIIIGSSDGIMIAGIALLYILTGSVTMSAISVETNSALTWAAFLTLAAGSFAKAGAFPFHSWIPDYTQKAPAASSAFLPASLDKLLGIYFLVRICHNLFQMSDILRTLILAAGAVTIITAVMMALVQHDYKKLLGFHAVSQVGYMVLGIGLGSVIGLAAGLFHMLNNAMYKSGLFLVAGNIKRRTGEDDLDRIGGLSQRMPVTFVCGLIFALSISGIPPFNGFASKWMIYQGIIDFGSTGSAADGLWILWLAIAVLGSALTLASFIKFIGGAFLGSLPDKLKEVRETGILMWLPAAVLALLCTLTGVFATSWFVPKMLYPVTGQFEFHGVWQSAPVSLLILFSIVLGGLIYLATVSGKLRRAESFTGGEKMTAEKGYPVTGFYGTIRNARVLSAIYDMADKSLFDIYHLSKNCILRLNRYFSLGHDGVLQTYMVWILAGLVILMLIL